MRVILNGDFECPRKVGLIALAAHILDDMDHEVLDFMILRDRICGDKVLDHGLGFGLGGGGLTVRACRRRAVRDGLGLHRRDILDVVFIDDVA